MSDSVENRYVRLVTKCMMRGLLIFMLSIGIIITQDKERLFSLFFTNQIPFTEIFPALAFIFSCVYIWYYTWMGAKLRRRRLQIWIGYTRAVVVAAFVVLAHQYF